MVAIGLISYPLYLWHWPLLSFAHIIDTATPSLLTRTVLAVLAFPLAAATYHFVEKPIRFGPLGEKKAAVLLGLLLVVGAVGVGVFVRQGFPGRTMINQKRAPVERAKGEAALPCVGREIAAAGDRRLCVAHLNPGAKQRVVLWGDSHAAVWSMPLVALARARGFELIVLRHDGCPPIEGVWRPVNNASITLCETPDIMRRIEDGVVGLEPDVVVLAARWSLYSHGWVRNGRMLKANGFLADRPVSVATEETSQAALARQIPEFDRPAAGARHPRRRHQEPAGAALGGDQHPQVPGRDPGHRRRARGARPVHRRHLRPARGTWRSSIPRRISAMTPAPSSATASSLYFDDNHLSAAGVKALRRSLER